GVEGEASEPRRRRSEPSRPDLDPGTSHLLEKSAGVGRGQLGGDPRSFPAARPVDPGEGHRQGKTGPGGGRPARADDPGLTRDDSFQEWHRGLGVDAVEVLRPASYPCTGRGSRSLDPLESHKPMRPTSADVDPAAPARVLRSARPGGTRVTV